MDHTDSVASHLECRTCSAEYDLDTVDFPCRECSGILDVKYRLDDLEVARETVSNRCGSMWAYRELLPIRDESAIVSMGEGNTPLIDCPKLAQELGVKRLYLKDEGQNPTNTFKDRGQSAAISAAKEQGVDQVALPSAGNAGQSASAYAARAGMNCHVFLNYQAGGVKKDLVRAHGADLHLVDGKIDGAGRAFNEARKANGWYSVATFQTPFRHEGKKTMGYEIYEDLDWRTPAEIVYPTGGGVGLIGIWKAYQEARSIGWLEDGPPRLTVAQTTGAAPVVKAIQAGQERHEPWEQPSTIAKGVEIPNPGASSWIIEAVRETNGGAVCVDDEDALATAIRVARSAGVEMCVTAAVALAGAIERAAAGAYEPDDEIVVVNTGAGVKTSAQLGEYAIDR